MHPPPVTTTTLPLSPPHRRRCPHPPGRGTAGRHWSLGCASQDPPADPLRCHDPAPVPGCDRQDVLVTRDAGEPLRATRAPARMYVCDHPRLAMLWNARLHSSFGGFRFNTPCPRAVLRSWIYFPWMAFVCTKGRLRWSAYTDTWHLTCPLSRSYLAPAVDRDALAQA